MKEKIINNLDNPHELEKLYRDNKSNFRKEFMLLYPEISDRTSAQIWNERLNFEQEDISWGKPGELVFILVASIIAGLIAKLPAFTGTNQEFFYSRNIGFIVFPVLAAYFAYRQVTPVRKVLLTGVAMLIAGLYINFLPHDPGSDTLVLSCLHLPLFLWALTGNVFTGGEFSNLWRRLDFLKYNANLVVMSAVIVIAGGILTAVTIGLFDVIGLNIEQFYFDNIVIFGLATIPVFGSFLVQTNTQLVSKVSPVIARIFTPLVLVMLATYLVAVAVSGKDPYNDREFLMIFNLLLIGVMAIILFSVVEIPGYESYRTSAYLLLSLAVLTIIVNGIALSAILFRIAEWGITPNRLAVSGANLLILINLLLVTGKLFRALKNKHAMEDVGLTIAAYLPVYFTWTAIVIFVFPFVFGFR